MNRIRSLNKKQEIILIVILYGGFMTAFFLVLGLFGCGYHFVDDPDYLYYHVLYDRMGRGFTDIVKSVLREDMMLRFRPIYISVRPTLSLLLGTNLIPFSIIRFLETIITMIVLHAAARRSGNGFLSSVAFVFVSMIGYQSCNFWKLGTPEAVSTMWFATTFWLLLKYLDERKGLFFVLELICFTIMCLSKENYILLGPFMILYAVYHEDKSSEFSFAKFKKILKKNRCIIAVHAVIIIAALTVMGLTCGFNSYGNISVNVPVSVSEYSNVWQEALSKDLKWFKLFGILFFMILLTYWDDLKKAWKEAILFLGFVLPQIYIYLKPAIKERYILPVSIGFAYFFILVPFRKDLIEGMRKRVYIVGMILLMLAHLRAALREADYFRLRGNGIQQVLDILIRLSEDNPGIKVLSCINPNEEGDQAIYCNQLLAGFDNVYVWMKDDNRIGRCRIQNIYHIYDDFDLNEYDIKEMGVAVAYNRQDRHYDHEMPKEFDADAYTKYECGTVDLYIRNDVKVNFEIPKVRDLLINF